MAKKEFEVYDVIHRKTWRRQLASTDPSYKPEDYDASTNLRLLSKWVKRVAATNPNKRFVIYAVCTENNLHLSGESGKAELFTIDDPDWFADRLAMKGDKVAVEGFIADLDEFLDNQSFDWSPLEV